MNKLLRDRNGSVLVESTLVLPVLLLVALGTVDVTYMLYDWALANKATYVGVRTAITSDPVAGGITNLTWNAALVGQPCIDRTTGAANIDGGTGATYCPSVSTVCTPTSGTGGDCTSGAFDDGAFTQVFTVMQTIFPRLQRENVQIAYQTNGLGFVGRPDGLPMDVTVSIRCMTHEFYFIGSLMSWTFSALPQGCPAAAPGVQIPAFATTLPSEDMVTN